MAPAHTAIHSAAYERTNKDIAPLPLFAYTAVGWNKGRFWVSALRSDPDNRQDARSFDSDKIKRKTIQQLKKNSQNRLIQHLGKCCLTYGCPAARNYFLGRWEAPLPTSPSCNARCVGCISLQSSGCCPATQDRINFVPRVSEISAIAVPHLKQAPGAIVSFGQGCEGEPLMQASILEKAIRSIRSQTERGTINLNSNASLPEKIKLLAEAGLDSLRVSLNSAREQFHARYYRPVDFTLSNVLESIDVMKKANRFVSLNYFILPGFTDDPDEFAALCRLIENFQPDLIQLRNLNMDPDWYLETVEYDPDIPPMGIRNWLAELKRLFPKLRFGYFNPSLR
jgi:pyruvate-formate lyase-activating enzyme